MSQNDDDKEMESGSINIPILSTEASEEDEEHRRKILDASIEKLISSDDGSTRALGRLTATEIHTIFFKWLKSEFDAETEPFDVFVAMARFFGSFFRTTISGVFNDTDGLNEIKPALEEEILEWIGISVLKIQKDRHTTAKDARTETKH